MRRLQYLLPLLAIPPIKWFLRRGASRVKGPDAAARARARMEIWGRVANRDGSEVTMTMTTPEGYAFTALSAVAAVKRVLRDPVRAGSFTPSMRLGPDFVTTIPGVVIV
jgi:short subunit dehydrogenase-like uncharacterized protein